MSIKHLGGIFGRNPDLNNVEATNIDLSNTLSVDGLSSLASVNTTGQVLVGTTSISIADEGFKMFANGVVYSVVDNAETNMLVNKVGYVSGNSYYLDFRLNGNFKGSISSDGTNVAYNTASDERMKENIVDAPESADIIDAIQIRSFDWIDNGRHQTHGVIAQELSLVAPEAVSIPADTEQMAGVDLSKLVPILIKEIQSLRARVAQIEGN